MRAATRQRAQPAPPFGLAEAVSQAISYRIQMPSSEEYERPPAQTEQELGLTDAVAELRTAVAPGRAAVFSQLSGRPQKVR